jgi:hypothetical protein
MPRPPRGKPISRLNLEMSETMRFRLENLRITTDADSLAEVVRRAINVYDFLWREQANGRRLVTQDHDGKTIHELVLM